MNDAPSSPTPANDPTLARLLATYEQLQQARVNLFAARDRYTAEARRRYDARVGALAKDAPNLHRVLAPWTDPVWQTELPREGDPTPAAVRIGRLEPGLTDYELPALLPVIGGPHLFVQTDDLAAGQSALQSLLLRLALTAAPGAVKFRLVDPISGGAGFASLLRLPPVQRGAKVATRPPEVASMIDDLVGHIDMVSQTRLLDVYPTVEAYNSEHPESAVPYIFLVFATVPTWLSSRDQQNLKIIRENGTRTGVYMLAAGLTNSTPDAFAGALIMRLANGQWQWLHASLGELTAQADPPPPLDIIVRWAALLQLAFAQSAGDLAFRHIALPVAARWQGDATEELRVRVGLDESGGIYELSLGRTNHHALVGGAPGSGTARLLDTLALQATLAYSPSQVGLYLADLGADWDVHEYAGLPHVRALALDAERELALGVLRRAHAEMARRKNDPASREIDNAPFPARHAARNRLPRQFVLINEFVGLIETDDRIAHEALKLLEEIARHGAEYGFHLVLASQSPNLPAAFQTRILGSFGLRVAFRCDPVVSSAILGAGNDAASELELSGEAICNAAMGNRNRNVRVRVAAADALARRELVREVMARFGDSPPTAVTFANQPGISLAANPDWRAALSAGLQPRGRSQKLWLGAALEDASPIAAPLRCEAGRNALIAGSDEAQAYALLASAILSLAAQVNPSQLRFIVADFARPETVTDGLMSRLADQLPHWPAVVNGRQAIKLLAELSAIVAERTNAIERANSTICFCIAGLHRWRDLRLPPDMLSAGGESAPDVSTQLVRLLVDGPDVGVHVIAWVDTVVNFERALKRGSLNAFDLRVGLPMPQADSLAFLDTPAAVRLDEGRALFCDLAETPDPVKFRPYPLPDEATSQAVREWVENISRPVDRPVEESDAPDR